MVRPSVSVVVVLLFSHYELDPNEVASNYPPKMVLPTYMKGWRRVRVFLVLIMTVLQCPV